MDYIDENEIETTEETPFEDEVIEEVQLEEEVVEEVIEEDDFIEEEDVVPEIRESHAHSHEEEPKKKKNLLVGFVALVLIIAIVVFGAYTIFGKKTIGDIEKSIYDLGMKTIDLIKREKLLTVDIMSADVDMQVALGDDFLIMQEFDAAFNATVSAGGAEAVTDTQYFLQIIAVGLSAQLQERALYSLIDEINYNQEAWSFLDTSGLPDVAVAYNNIWKGAIDAINTKNMDKIKTYYDTSAWMEELVPLEEYLQMFDAQMAAQEELLSMSEEIYE